MRQSTPQLRQLATRLIAHEARENKSSGTTPPTAFPVCERLRPTLTALVGNTGFGALMSRALALGQEEVAWLRAVHVKADGLLGGLTERDAELGGEKFLEGRVVLLAQLLGLIGTFIGADLTMQLIRDAWPKLALNDVYFSTGDENEIEKHEKHSSQS